MKMSMQNMSENKQRWIFSKKKLFEVEKMEEVNEEWLDLCDGKQVDFEHSEIMGICVVKSERGVVVPFLIDKAWCEKVELEEDQEEEESE